MYIGGWGKRQPRDQREKQKQEVNIIERGGRGGGLEGNISGSRTIDTATVVV